MKVTYGAIVQRASGRFGGTVHSNWKGIDVVRRFAAPSNPNTANQQEVRAGFQNLTRMYQMLPVEHAAAWTAYAVGKKAIARNLLIGRNMNLFPGATDWSDLIALPAMAGAVPPSSYTPVGGNDVITTTITFAVAPTGWNLTKALAGAIPHTDPSALVSFAENTIFEITDATDPYTPTIVGLPAGDYWTWAAGIYTAPDGSTRYSAPLMHGAAITVN